MRMTLPSNPPRPISTPIFSRRLHQPHGFDRRGSLGAAVLHQFDRLHQPHAPDIPDQRILILQVFETRPQVSPDLGRVSRQVLFSIRSMTAFAAAVGIGPPPNVEW